MEEGLRWSGQKLAPGPRLQAYHRQEKGHSFSHWGREAGSWKQEAGSRSTYFSELIGRGLGRKQREVSLLQEVWSRVFAKREGFVIFCLFWYLEASKMWRRLKDFPLWKANKEHKMFLAGLQLIHGKSDNGILTSISLEPLFCPLYHADGENLCGFMFIWS